MHLLKMHILILSFSFCSCVDIIMTRWLQDVRLGKAVVGNVLPCLICWSVKKSLMSRFRGGLGNDNMAKGPL